MAWIPSDLKATLESVFAIGSAAVSGARDLIFRNTAGTIRIRGTPTGDHTITAPAATGTMIVSGQDATLNSLTVDTTNANIQLAELGTNAGLEMQGKTGKAAYIDLKHDNSPNFTGRWITESATATTLWGGSGVTFNCRSAFQVLSTVHQLTTATGTVSVLRYASGTDPDFADNTICWDFTKTTTEDFAVYRYNSGTPTEVYNINKSTGLTTFTGSITFNAAIRLPTTSISAAGQLRRNTDRLEFGNSTGTAITLLDSASAISATASTMPNLQVIGSTRSFEVLAAGNNIRTEIRNAISGGLIIRDQTLDAVASGADFHVREILNSATDYQVLGGAGLTYRFSLPVSFETTLAVPTTAIAAAGQLRRNGDNLEFGNSSGTAVTLLNSAGNLSNLSNITTARTNLGLGTIATQNATAVDIAGKRTAINITGNVTLDSSHIGRKLRVTASADLTLSSILGAADDEIDIIIATSGTVRAVQGSGATLTWHNGTSTQTGTRTFLGNGAVAGIYFTATGAAIIAGGVN